MIYKIEKLKNGKYEITIEEKSLFGKPRKRVFVGDSTVWHELPEFKRPSTYMESRLSNLWAKYKHEESLRANQ